MSIQWINKRSIWRWCMASQTIGIWIRWKLIYVWGKLCKTDSSSSNGDRQMKSPWWDKVKTCMGKKSISIDIASSYQQLFFFSDIIMHTKNPLQITKKIFPLNVCQKICIIKVQFFIQLQTMQQIIEFQPSKLINKPFLRFAKIK